MPKDGAVDVCATLVAENVGNVVEVLGTPKPVGPSVVTGTTEVVAVVVTPNGNPAEADVVTVPKLKPGADEVVPSWNETEGVEVVVPIPNAGAAVVAGSCPNVNPVDAAGVLEAGGRFPNAEAVVVAGAPKLPNEVLLCVVPKEKPVVDVVVVGAPKLKPPTVAVVVVAGAAGVPAPKVKPAVVVGAPNANPAFVDAGARPLNARPLVWVLGAAPKENPVVVAGAGVPKENPLVVVAVA